MSPIHAFFVGLLAAAAFLGILHVREGQSMAGELLLALLAVPLAGLAGAAVFGTGDAGRSGRALRGGLGAGLAAVAGFAAFHLLEGTGWLSWPHEHRDVVMILFALVAAVPGGTAAAAATPRHGLALAGGLTVGLGAALLLVAPPGTGLPLLLALGTLVGALVSALGERA